MRRVGVRVADRVGVRTAGEYADLADPADPPVSGSPRLSPQPIKALQRINVILPNFLLSCIRGGEIVVSKYAFKRELFHIHTVSQSSF